MISNDTTRGAGHCTSETVIEMTVTYRGRIQPHVAATAGPDRREAAHRLRRIADTLADRGVQLVDAAEVIERAD